MSTLEVCKSTDTVTVIYFWLPDVIQREVSAQNCLASTFNYILIQIRTTSDEGAIHGT